MSASEEVDHLSAGDGFGAQFGRFTDIRFLLAAETIKDVREFLDEFKHSGFLLFL
jgi:hypothetical protein